MGNRNQREFVLLFFLFFVFPISALALVVISFAILFGVISNSMGEGAALLVIALILFMVSTVIQQVISHRNMKEMFMMSSEVTKARSDEYTERARTDRMIEQRKPPEKPKEESVGEWRLLEDGEEDGEEENFF